MPPVDSTPNINTGAFELSYSVLAYDRIPVSEYKSKNTGLTVVIAEVEGPIVNGFFCVVTEAFDDDGLPHTLEHMIFLGSELFPYKGVLDLLANRCLASGTNAWTDVDHTCYTMETAGSEGFLALMPIYLEHILYPTLHDEGFLTEVHHIAGNGQDAGVVYCEMQGRENSAESRIHLEMARRIYPGKCGYSSETGGLMKNLRESTTNEKVKAYHKEFYRPENLKVVITGQVKPEDVFKALAALEEKIMSKGDRGPFQRPWQSPVPPVEKSEEVVIRYPSDEEKNGIFAIAWRGPSAVHDMYSLTACSIFLKYLTDTAVSPLQKEFVEIPDPYASSVQYSLYENSSSCLYLMFENVPMEKLPQVKPKLQAVFKKMMENEDIDMHQMNSVINKHKLECLSNMENDPQHTIAFMIIGHMLYGNTKDDLYQRINVIPDLEKLLKEPQSYWVNLLRQYFIDNSHVAIQAIPSIKEHEKMTAEEKARIEKQIETLGEKGLKEKAKILEKAIEFNEREPPESMLTSVSVPSTKSINFHQITRFKTDSEDRKQIDLSDTPVFTYFDHVKTGFVYMFALMDTSTLPPTLREYLPLLIEILFESPIERDGKIIPYEEVVQQLNDDTVTTAGNIGLGYGKLSYFKCGSYAQTCTLMIQVEAAKFEKGVQWLQEILYKTVLTAERMEINANKMVNAVAQAKRSGRDVATYVMKSLCYSEESNQYSNGILKQQRFLTKLLEQLQGAEAKDVVDTMEKVRKTITHPSNLALYFAANLDVLKPSAADVIKNLIPIEFKGVINRKGFNVTPDWKLIKPISEADLRGCVVGMACLESSFFYQAVPSINSYKDPDLPALFVYIQYLVQTEGPMWKQIRGKGLSYGYRITLKVNEGLLYLGFYRSTDVVGAYRESRDIVTKQLNSKKWDDTLLESAKSSLIFEMIEEEKTIGNVVSLSLHSYFQDVDYQYNREIITKIETVTKSDLNKVGPKYLGALFDPDKVKTAVANDPAKSGEIAAGFKRFGLKVDICPSLEESFLKE